MAFGTELFVVICIYLVCRWSSVGAVGTNFEVEEDTNVSLPCDFRRYNLSYTGIPFKKVWILPNASVIHDNYISDYKYEVYRPDGYTLDLRIADVTTDDFGVYHCMLLWNNVNYAMSAIRVGLNEDYPYYRKRWETMRLASIIAGVAIGIIFLAIIVAFCIWRQRANASNEGSHDAKSLSRTSDGYSQQGTTRIRTGYAYDGSHGPDGHLGSEGYRRDAVDHRQEPEIEVYASVKAHRCLRADQKENPLCRSVHDKPADLTAHM